MEALNNMYHNGKRVRFVACRSMNGYGCGVDIPHILADGRATHLQLIRIFKTHYRHMVHGNFERYSTRHLIDLGDVSIELQVQARPYQFCDFELNMYLVGLPSFSHFDLYLLSNNFKEAVKEAVVERILLASCMQLGDPTILIKQFLASPKMYEHHLDSVNWYQK